jgi:hypothetical protein
MTARIPVVTDGKVRPPSPPSGPAASISKGVAETHTLMVVDDNLIIRKMIGTSPYRLRSLLSESLCFVPFFLGMHRNLARSAGLRRQVCRGRTANHCTVGIRI